jgi:hypothetical protein
MKVLKFDVYRDGGTIEITTNEGVFCVDGRINTKTRDAFYFGYPNDDDSNVITNSRNLELEIIEALKSYEDIFFDEAIKLFIESRTRHDFDATNF